jgi:hypothetical protein
VKREFRPDYATAPAPTSGSVRGTIFNDTNHNGRQDSGEAGITGVVVYLDADGNGRRNNGEKYVRTNSAGSYRFIKLTNDTYRVRQQLPTGATLVAPSQGYHDVRIIHNRAVGGRNFANALPLM